MAKVNDKLIQSFRVYDSRGRTYTIIEYSRKASGGVEEQIFKTEDGYPVQKLDSMNYEIQKRNPGTNENRIEVHR